MTFAKIAPTLRGLGYETIPLYPGKKNPSIDSWQSVVITEEKVAQWASNGKADHGVGVRTGTGQIALYGADNDFYDKNVAVKVRKSFVDHFGEGLVRVGQAPKSLMVYAGAPGATKITSPVWMSPDGREHKFEMLGAGQQFVAFGIHEKTGQEYLWPNGSILDVETWELIEIDPVKVAAWVRNVLPTLIPADWSVKGSTRGSAPLQPTDTEERRLLNYKPKLDLDWDEVRRMVLSLDASMKRDEWYRVVMAIHHQCDGADEGLDLADEWSRSGSNYKNRRDVETVWRSVEDDPARGAVVTMATVIKMLRDLAPEVKIAQRRTWEQQVADAQDEHQVASIAELAGKDHSLAPVDIAKLVGLIQDRLKVFGVRMPLSQIRNMIKPPRSNGIRGGAGGLGEAQDGAPMETWCEPYVWCQFEDCFIHVPTQEAISVQSFNARHGRDVKGVWVTPEGFQLQASVVALQEIQIPVVARRMYLPWALEQFSMDGLDYLNTYRPNSVPVEKEAWEFDDQDNEAIEAVKVHLVNLLGSKEADVLIKWIAYCVQHPGRKVRWSPLIKGIEGDGKSLIGEVIARVMGRPNVRTIAPKVLLTDFNGYAEGACVGILEELKMAGHNRHDAANALKPNVTNDTIDIHRKGMDPYNIVNTMNYIGFTNHADALPLTDADRRWWVLFSKFTEAVMLPPAHYFDKLFNLIRNHTAALRGWLLGVDLTAFNPNGRAPDSAAKAAMVAAGLHEEDEAILEVIAAGATGVSKDVISTWHLVTAISIFEPNLTLNTRTLSSALIRLGFVRVPRQLKWDGAPRRVWIKDIQLFTNNMSTVRKLLDDTKQMICDEKV